MNDLAASCDAAAFTLLEDELEAARSQNRPPAFGIVGAGKRARLAAHGHDYEPTCGYLICSCAQHHPAGCTDAARKGPTTSPSLVVGPALRELVLS